ncbi:MAG: transporter substrate-binding domain-containing protein [Christensenellaceae bacterium]|nr:transporter substrate-binding domain-containing protein [Christensenellaceae bacterium]
MKKMVKVIAIVAVLVMALCCFAGCGKKSAVEKIQKAGKLTVLTEPGFAPFEYIDADGNIAGVDVEISKKVAAELGVEAEVIAMAFDGIISAVQAGKGDIGAAGITATEERAQMVSFSTNYVDTGIYIIVPEGSEKVASPADIGAGVAVGVQLGTTSDLFVSDTEAEVGRYTTVADAVVALQAGKVDAVVADELPAKDAVTNNPGLVIIDEPLTVEQYAIAVNKDNADLLEVVNKVVEEMVESGEMAELIAEHMELAAAVG